MSFSSMYVGATGVIAHGQQMQVVANNLANVSTVGYKRADTQFGDLISKQMTTGGSQYSTGAVRASQIGMGVAVADIRTIFQEGGLENTNTVTDLAITGNGFFGTRNINNASSTGASHYTRAGVFRFNNDAYLVDPHDFRLQGYAIDRDTGTVDSSVSDIQLPYEDITVDGVDTRVVRSDPFATSSIEMVTNLDASASDVYTSSSNPFFAMLDAYDGTLSNAASPFGDTLPAYSSALNVYDSDGNKRELNFYFDPVDTDTISNATPGYTYWEYLVALPASADGSSAYGTSGAGLAGLGVLTFNGSGELIEHAAFSLNTEGAGKTLSSWGVAEFGSGGVPSMTFLYGSNGSSIGSTESIIYDFGVSSSSSSWTDAPSNAGAVGVFASNLQTLTDRDRDVNITTSYDSGSVTLYSSQDGYSWGYLQYTEVSREGVLSGFFTNGQQEDFYQLAIYRFNSEWGLRRDGNNNFVATEASGSAIEGTALENGRGSINQNALEQSNVDMAEEFADMILTQRGYQANSKIITTSDSLLNTTISIKR